MTYTVSLAIWATLFFDLMGHTYVSLRNAKTSSPLKIKMGHYEMGRHVRLKTLTPHYFVCICKFRALKAAPVRLRVYTICKGHIYQKIRPSKSHICFHRSFCIDMSPHQKFLDGPGRTSKKVFLQSTRWAAKHVQN